MYGFTGIRTSVIGVIAMIYNKYAHFQSKIIPEKTHSCC